MHDTIGCYLDIEKGHVKFSKNGKLLSTEMCSPPVIHSPLILVLVLLLLSPLSHPPALDLSRCLPSACSLPGALVSAGCVGEGRAYVWVGGRPGNNTVVASKGLEEHMKQGWGRPRWQQGTALCAGQWRTLLRWH